MATPSAGRWYWPLILYFLTGFTGLLAEQSFERYISLLVGATVSASAVVLFAYFLGFAIGGAAAAELIRRGRIKNPWRVYGVIELIIGLACISITYWFHPLSGFLAPMQADLESRTQLLAVRFLIGSLYLLPAAILMGASFPLLAQVVDGRGESGGRRWAQIYGMNLAGAVAATALAPYVLLPYLGVRGTLWLCCAICILVFVVTRRVSADAQEPQVETQSVTSSALDKDAWLLLAGAFACGAVFFALEVIWTHLIGVAIGSSIYAFSSMLLMVLIGLFLAACRVERQIAKGLPALYSKLFFLSSLALMVQFRAWDYTQAIFVWSPPSFLHGFVFAQTVKLLITAFLIIPSAVLIGSIYPSLLASPSLKRPGRSFLVGHLNAWNSAGCLAGALFGLFVLIPRLGAEAALKSMVVLLLVLGVLFVWREQPIRKEVTRAIGFAAIMCVYLVWWSWDQQLLTFGGNVYFGTKKSVASAPLPSAEIKVSANTADDRQPEHEIIYFHEDAQGGITTVVRHRYPEPEGKWRTLRVLLTNGKFQGNDAPDGEMVAQYGLSILPSLFTDRRDTAMQIGLGTGNTTAALLFTGYRSVHVAEFAEGIVGAAETVFNDINHDALRSPAVRMHLEDGRNVLLVRNGDPFDLLTIELNSIWFAGSTNLYSREFYEVARRNLREDGVMQQWIQLHHISMRELACALATVRAEFPYVSLWNVGSQGMIIATNHEQTIPEERKNELASRLAATGKPLPMEPGLFVETIATSQIAPPADVDRLIKELNPVINTDHNRWMEYSTPLYNASDVDWLRKNLDYFTALRSR